jgi:putative phosphoribosyl transferase
MINNLFKDRSDAAKKLASLLSSYKNSEDTIILALPRGGVVIGKALSEMLKLPLDIIVPRKIEAPSNPELAIGAIAKNEVILNKELIEELNISESFITKTIEEETIEANRRENTYRKNKPTLLLKGKTILLVDDGIATGSTMLVSIKALKKMSVKNIIVIAPVAPKDTIEKINSLVEKVIIPHQPANFMGISQFYDSFEQISDEQVISLLEGKT